MFVLSILNLLCSKLHSYYSTEWRLSGTWIFLNITITFHLIQEVLEYSPFWNSLSCFLLSHSPSSQRFWSLIQILCSAWHFFFIFHILMSLSGLRDLPEPLSRTLPSRIKDTTKFFYGMWNKHQNLSISSFQVIRLKAKQNFSHSWLSQLLSHHWDKMFIIHKLKKKRLIFIHSLSPWLVSSMAGTKGRMVWQRKGCSTHRNQKRESEEEPGARTYFSRLHS